MLIPISWIPLALPIWNLTLDVISIIMFMVHFETSVFPTLSGTASPDFCLSISLFSTNMFVTLVLSLFCLYFWYFHATHRDEYPLTSKALKIIVFCASSIYILGCSTLTIFYYADYPNIHIIGAYTHFASSLIILAIIIFTDMKLEKPKLVHYGRIACLPIICIGMIITFCINEFTDRTKVSEQNILAWAEYILIITDMITLGSVRWNVQQIELVIGEEDQKISSS
ncbi:Frag1/DRAM/Sfk1 like protein [Aduncisulcus paluster]|uniref:Frag1/DRAM/Sfk1 like protein n=1 Tax=Aduncisulcus paluster TaxID=2918883 RepID=A0ABQ5K7N2_9EUKA|nr:Frag1/DRAM/Sfk1 like protein [Aduncisulcus paluster]